MARYRGPVCRMCRREGEKLFLKGDRCYSNKCAIERRDGGPGQHGKGRQKFSEYKIQLREKQKIKRMYGLLEGQFRAYADKAARSKGVTGTELLLLLERRLDNMVYRMGFAVSRKQARQLVRHNHVTVNGKKVNIPSYRLSVGDVVAVSESSKQLQVIQSSLASSVGRLVAEWVALDRDGCVATITALPKREQLTHPMKEQLVV